MLVTGASGFIGRHLCRSLLELGADVVAAGRREPPTAPAPGCTPVSCELARPGDADRLLAVAQPQAVFHLAAHVTGRTDLELVAPALTDTLAAAVWMLLAAARARGDDVRVVLLGSSEEPSLLGADTTPTSPYAAAKASLALWARLFRTEYGLDVSIVRPSLVYGPGQAPEKLVPSLIAAALDGEEPALRTPARLCDPIYVDDAVHGLLLAGAPGAAPEGELELRGGNTLRVDELAGIVARLVAGDAGLGQVARPSSASAPERPHSWAPAWTLEAGLAATIEAYREARVEAGAVR